jgi:hypothetical protein
LEESTDGVMRYLEARFPDGVRVERTVTSVDDLRG